MPRTSPGWVPNYHGGWAMVTVPALMGVILSGFVWEHVILLVTWWVGYFAFFAAGLWLRSGGRPRYFPPVRTYGLITLACGIALIFVAPYLIWWVPLFLPLVVTTAWASATRNERSIINDVATIGAAGLMLAVAYDVGTRGDGGIWGMNAVEQLPGVSANGALTGWSWIWVVTLLVTTYFIGTAFYVKTNIRERGSTRWLIASIGFHALGCIFAVTLGVIGVISWWHVAVWAALLARTIAVPLYGTHRRWLSPAQIGFTEVAFSLLVAITLLS